VQEKRRAATDVADKKFVRSVLKALSIVELLDEKGELGVTEIGTILDMDKSTTFRLLATLKEKGYIAVNSSTQKYSNASKFFILGQSVVRRHGLNPVLGAELKKLAEVSGETVNFAVADGAEVVYLASHETEDIVKLAGSIGQRRPMYCTSVGKAILAHYKPEYIQAMCSQFPFVKYTEFTVVTPEALLEDLARIRERGYSEDNQEHSLSIHCVAIPLLNRQGVPLGAVSISMPQFRHEADPHLHERCVKALLAASATLSHALLA
jgi:Transcriptional regulator